MFFNVLGWLLFIIILFLNPTKNGAKVVEHFECNHLINNSVSWVLKTKNIVFLIRTSDNVWQCYQLAINILLICGRWALTVDSQTKSDPVSIISDIPSYHSLAVSQYKYKLQQVKALNDIFLADYRNNRTRVSLSRWPYAMHKTMRKIRTIFINIKFLLELL